MGNLFSGGPSSTTYQANPAITNALTQLLGEGGGLIGSTGAPYYDPSTAQQYAGFVPGLVAPQTPEQINAINNITNLQGGTQPFYSAAEQMTSQAATPMQMRQFSLGGVNQYMSPYISDVANAAMGNINQTNAQQQQQVLGNAMQKGAFGGDRAGIAQAELARQQDLANNATISNLYNQGYTQALGEFNQQQGVDLATQLQNRNLLSQNALNLANLATGGQNAALQQAQAQYGAGATEQQQLQNQLSTAYQQYMNQYQNPYGQLGWLGSLISGAAPAMGGTTTGQPASPSIANTIGGIGTMFSALGKIPGLGFKEGGAVKGYATDGAVTAPKTDPAVTDALNAIYEKDFGRAYNPTTDSYWADQIASGKDSLSNMAQLQSDIAGGAQGFDRFALQHAMANKPMVDAYNAYGTLANSGNASLGDLRNSYNSYLASMRPTSGVALPSRAISGASPFASLLASLAGAGAGLGAGTSGSDSSGLTDATASGLIGRGHGEPSTARNANYSSDFRSSNGPIASPGGYGPYSAGGGGGASFNFGGPLGGLLAGIGAALTGGSTESKIPKEEGYTGVTSSMGPDKEENRGGRIHSAKGGLIPTSYGLMTKDDLAQLNADVFGSGVSNDTPSEQAFGAADVLSGMNRGGVVGHYAPGGAATDDSSDEAPVADTSVIQNSAKNAGIPVDQFVKLSQGESGHRFKLGDDNSSAGPFQLHVGGASKQYPNPGKGDDFFNEMHPDLAEKLTPQQKAAYINDPSHLQETSDWTANEIAKNGANAWTVARQQGLLGARQADMPYVNAKNAAAQAGDQTGQGSQNKSILSGLFPGLADPERLALFKFGATLAGTPGPFGYGLAKAADAYANQLVESQKLASESNLRAAQAEAQKGEAITKRATLGRAGALVSTMNPDGSISLQQIPIGGMGGGQSSAAAPSIGGGEFNIPPASQSGTTGGPSGGGAGPSTGAPSAPTAPVGPEKAKPLQTFAYGSIREDGLNADKKNAAIQQEIDAINNDVSSQYGPRSQQLATQADAIQNTATKEGSAAYNGRQDLQTLTKAVASQDSTGLLASGIQKAFRDRMANYAQTVGAMTGNDLGWSDKLSAQEQANKIATWASVQQGRHAGFITQGLENAFPTGALQPETQRSLLASMITQNKRAQDLQNFTTDYNQKTNNLGWNAEKVFQKTNPPSEYARDAQAIEALMALSDKTPAGQGNLHPNPITDLMNRKYGPKSAEYFDQYVHNLYVKTGDPRFAVHNLSRYFE